MSYLAYFFLILGSIVVFVGLIQFYIAAFQTSLLWGFCCLFIPLTAPVFLFLHWERAGKPFLIHLAGYVPILIGYFIVPAANGSS